MKEAIEKSGMFAQDTHNQGLWNFLDKVKATPEQEHDLLKFRETGQTSFETYVTTKLLRKPSTNTPGRKKRLCNFSTSKTEKKRIKQIEKERRLSQRFLKRQLSWISEHGSDSISPETIFGPISLFPKALVDASGLPYKSTKSSTTNYLESRYKNTPVVVPKFPDSWIPDSAILEGMFMIQTPPLPAMFQMKDYVQLLLGKYVQPHLRAGVTEVHVVFDNPWSFPETPKELEHVRRDKFKDLEHMCIEFTSNGSIPNKWRSILACRKCKKKLTQFISNELLNTCPKHLNQQQKFLTNVGVTTYSVGSSGVKVPEPTLRSNADEGDLRVWLHCKHSAGNRKLVFSPDTDIYHIGLTVAPTMPNSDIYVQLSKTPIDEARFLHLSGLLQAINNDPELADIEPITRAQALQTLYVCTECDYISFFQGLGKVTFLKTFYRFSNFIFRDHTLPGSLGVITTVKDNPELLSFLRLVGCTYYNCHISAFEQRTPEAVFNSFTSTSSFEQHKKWLERISRVIWPRVESESQTMPSTESLCLHWRRCQWVIKMWHQCTLNDKDLPELKDYGWERNSGQLQVVWDVPENLSKVQARLDFAFSGCKCKTGCGTRRCKCRKGDRQCGPACQCVSCQNLKRASEPEEDHEQIEDHDKMDQDDSDTELVDDSEDDLDCEPEEIEEVMDFVFGFDEETLDNDDY